MENKDNAHRVALGEQLRKIREDKGMSIRELAERADIHFSNVGKIELGKYNVSIDVLNRICKVLGCQITLKKEDHEEE